MLNESKYSSLGSVVPLAMFGIMMFFIERCPRCSWNSLQSRFPRASRERLRRSESAGRSLRQWPTSPQPNKVSVTMYKYQERGEVYHQFFLHRVRIVELAQLGIRPCDISRQLRFWDLILMYKIYDTWYIIHIPCDIGRQLRSSTKTQTNHEMIAI